MALHQARERLIFAPSGSPSPASTPAPGADGLPAPPVAAAAAGQAAQFVRHEAAGGLRRADLDLGSPAAQFHAWFAAASAPGAGVAHPETCTLSTAALPSGRVSARMVYLKELDAAGGFVVYSNFGTSRKAADLFGSGSGSSSGNPWVALTFWWEPLERQVRVEGRAARLSAEESQVYFDTRARGSRIGAWASRQSQVLRPRPGAQEDDGRAQLEEWVREAEARFAGVERVPVPEFWGGLRIVPERVEFWQGRASRLHDRFVYDRVHSEEGGESKEEVEGEEKWTVERLSP